MNLPLLALLLGGCAAKGPVDKDEVFSTSVDKLQKEQFADSANAAWSFLQVTNPDDPRYDRARRLLAQSAESSGMVYAAGILYRDIAKSRRNVELLPDSLLNLERIVRSGTYDEDTLLVAFIASDDFGILPDNVQPFIEFQKGLDLARRGHDDWAQVHFDRLDPESDYGARAAYVRSVQLVADGDHGGAIAALKTLREQDYVRPDLRQDIQRTLARVAFDEQRYDDALSHFSELKELAPDDPEILLEMAWTQFYLGDSRKTLGLLVALDAPVHASYIAPERFLLEALALRRLCQFGPARAAAVRLERRYRDSLDELSRGVLPREIPEIVAAARLRGHSLANSKLMDRLEYERGLIRQNRLDGELQAYLDDLYSRATAESFRRENETINNDLNQLTDELLAAQEGVHLIVHELGVSLLRGRRRPPGATEKAGVEIPASGEKVFYQFDGEYWTDELDDLVVIAEDRCID